MPRGERLDLRNNPRRDELGTGRDICPDRLDHPDEITEDLSDGNVLSLLTRDDWAAVSAAVGHDVGPDAAGKLPKLAPITAYLVATMRQDGTLPAGAPLTAQAWSYKFSDGRSLDPSDPRNDQFLGLVAYLKQHDAAMLANSAPTTKLDISV